MAVLQVAARMIDAARTREQPVGMLLLAIDPAQEGRSFYGNPMADAVLGGGCRRGRRALATTDVGRRYNRDELLGVLPGCAQEVIAATADRILRSVTSEPASVCGLSLPMALAIGGTIAERGAAELDELVIAADVALERARIVGGNRIEMRWPTASARLLR